MIKHFYRLLWQLLHILSCIYESIRTLYDLLWRSFDLVRASLSAIVAGQRNVQEHQLHSAYVRLKGCQSELKKLPQHIAIIVGVDEGHFNEEALANFLTYASIIDLDCISYYDTRPSHKGHISLATFHKHNSTQCTQLSSTRFTWCTEIVDATLTVCSKNSAAANGKPATNGCANGDSRQNAVSRKTIEVVEITENDGRPLIADVCRNLFEFYHPVLPNTKITTNIATVTHDPVADIVTCNPTSISNSKEELRELLSNRAELTDRIDELLAQRLLKISEPDLGIIFSRCLCTYGMLPWHTRFTEFHSCNSTLNVNEFINIMYKFARCEQRWGR